jgi:hypothetical protein
MRGDYLKAFCPCLRIADEEGLEFHTPRDKFHYSD